MTRYGTSTGGYVYNPGAGQSSFNATALDVTAGGDLVDEWVMYDSCNANAFPARDHAAAGGVFGPIAPMASLSTFREPRR